MGVKEFTERIKHMFLAENLKFLRESKGWTQREVANALDISIATIANYEVKTREPGLEMLIKIARFFSVTIDDLLLKKMEPPIPKYATNIRYLRELLGVTQESMANYLGYSGKQGYNNIETGKTKISVEDLDKLSNFFGVSMDDLVHRNMEDSERALSFKEMLGGE